ncbi:AbfB domain-containing protein [Paenibacillus lupini]|nr:AbfB domain-containing protein [Paenibacillus lupini]NIK24008.1 hypothetical protein [Paenibacillus lupini]
MATMAWRTAQSYNNPTRYIRHYNYVLRIDLISTTQEKADTTFREVT